MSLDARYLEDDVDLGVPGDDFLDDAFDSVLELKSKAVDAVDEKLAAENGFGKEDLDRMYDLEFEYCAKDFDYFSRFIVTDDEEREARRPYPREFEYLKELHKKVEKSTRVIILKPRRMLISLYSVARSLWRAKFAGTGIEGTPDVFYGGYAAMDETLALYQMLRISQFHHRLPLWLQERNPLIRDNVLEKVFEAGGKIQGFPMKKEGAQGFGFSEFIFDEAAWQEAAASTYKGLAPTIGNGRIIVISTPNGEEGTGELFYNMWHMKGGRYKNYTRIELDWRDNPEHDDEWFRKRVDDLQPWEIAQMYEKSFTVVSGDPICPNFQKSYHVSTEPLKIIPGAPIYIGWDFGFDHPAAVIMQRNTKDQWLILEEFCGDHIDFSIFCRLVLEQCNGIYDRKLHREIHCIDPAGLQVNTMKGISGARCDAEEIQKRWTRVAIDGRSTQMRVGMVQVGTREFEAPRIKELKKLWNLRSDGRYGGIVNLSCKTIAEGLAVGYVRDKYGKPVKNRFSHPIDAIQYVLTAFLRMVNPDATDSGKNKKRKSRPRIGLRTGM